jgi:hypothetical protein
MSNILFVPDGFIGDRLLTTSAIAVAKRYLPEHKMHLYLTPEFGYMDEVLMSTGVVDGLVLNQQIVSSEWDSVLTMPHCRFDTNPIKVYCESFMQNLPMDADLSPAFIDISKLSVSSTFELPTTPYITYQVDWQNRTSVNVSLIINKLTELGITCVPVGSMQQQKNQLPPNSPEFLQITEERRHSLNETLVLIAKAQLHLCMNGGTAMFAGYVHTRCAMTTDWFYIRHNENRLDPYAYLNWIKQTPRDVSNNPMHHMFNPVITEVELVEEVTRMLTSMSTFVMPPNLIKHPEFLDFFIRNIGGISFENKTI